MCLVCEIENSDWRQYWKIMKSPNGVVDETIVFHCHNKPFIEILSQIHLLWSFESRLWSNHTINSLCYYYAYWEVLYFSRRTERLVECLTVLHVVVKGTWINHSRVACNDSSLSLLGTFCRSWQSWFFSCFHKICVHFTCVVFVFVSECRRGNDEVDIC